MSGMEPSALELEAMQSFKDLFEWVPIRAPQSEALLTHLGFEASDPIRLLSKASAQDVEDMLVAVAGDQPPSLALRARVETAVETARLKAGVVKSQASIAAEEAAQTVAQQREVESQRLHELEVERLRLEAAAKQAAATSAASSAAAAAAAAAASTGSSTEAKPKGKGFNLNTVVNQLLDLNILPLSKDELHKLFKVYIEAEGGPPGEEHEPSVEQISAIKFLFEDESLDEYVDLAVFSPRHNQKKKDLFFTGLVVTAGNVLRAVEIRGPPTFQHWKTAMLVLRVIFIMLKLVSKAAFDGYVRRVERYWERYGDSAWALLYQAESRMRRDRFPIIWRYLAADADDDADHPFNRPEKRWSLVWSRAAFKERSYWQEEFTEIAHLVRIDRRVLAKELGTDAAIEGSRRDPVERSPLRRPRGSSPGGPATKKRKTNTREHHVDPTTGRFTHNRSGKRLCPGFQTGECVSAKGSLLCPKNANDSHQCDKCLDHRHGSCSDRCGVKDVKEITVPKVPAFRGRGGGRGSGGRGGGR